MEQRTNLLRPSFATGEKDHAVLIESIPFLKQEKRESS